jgi:rhodanese-related sulfurtransferase
MAFYEIFKYEIMKKRVLFSGLILIFSCVLFLVLDDGNAQEPKKILSIEAYDMLNTVPDTYIIDVRTRAEYQFVGHPVGAYLFPYMFLTKNLGKQKDQYAYQFDVENKNFVDEISNIFQKSNNLIIICRDGVRSELAAKALVRAGFNNVYDVADGFEGAEFPSFEDSNRHKFYRQLARRNKIHGFNHRRRDGWQWWGLPWTYEIDPKYIYPPDLTPP